MSRTHCPLLTLLALAGLLSASASAVSAPTIPQTASLRPQSPPGASSTMAAAATFLSPSSSVPSLFSSVVAAAAAVVDDDKDEDPTTLVTVTLPPPGGLGTLQPAEAPSPASSPEPTPPPPPPPPPAPTSSSFTAHCDHRFCSAGMDWCFYWGGITSYDIARGPVPGETHTILGACTQGV